jgi:hypothetical protein
MKISRVLLAIGALGVGSAAACSGDDTDTGAQAASTAGGAHGASGGAGGMSSSASGAGGCACDVTDGSRMASIGCGEMMCVNGHVYACSADEMLSMPDSCTGSGGAGGHN